MINDSDKQKTTDIQYITNQAIYGNWRMSLIILLLGLAFTSVLTFLLLNDVKDQTRNEFTLVCNEIKTKIDIRLNSHATLLQNCSSFFAASDTITREDWKIFISHSKLDQNLPGIEGVGYSYIVPRNQLEKHIRQIRNEGFPNYTIKPANSREFYTTILFLEPFSGRNLRAFGYDMYSEPVRRKAMEQARDNDLAALSGKVILVQESGQDLQAGTLMYIPIYKHRMPIQSVEERRKAIIGWVYSPYRMDDLMNGILGRWGETELGKIRLQIYDDKDIYKSSLLFDSQPNDSLTANSRLVLYSIPLDFNGKLWTLNFSLAVEKFAYYNNTVLVVIVSGILISFLLFALVLSLSKATIRMKISEDLAAQLKESEEKYRVLIENANEAIYVAQDEKIVFANKACELIAGVSFNEMSGCKINEVWVTEESQKLLQEQADLTSGKLNSISSEFLVKNRKDNTYWLLINSAQIMWNGKAGTLNMATNITERKQAEELIIQKNEELQNLNATKDKFFSIIAHDLRGPFSTFLGITELMAEGLSNLTQEDIKRLAQGMRKSATNLFRLLENLLQWSQLQQGKVPFNPITILLPKIITEGIDIVHEQASMKRIEIVTEIPEKLDVLADVNMTQTVIRNLLSNAVKFTHKGGKISVAAKPENDGFAIVSVTDTGIGMDQELIQNLFAIGTKISRKGTENEPSSGLGLLLCKEFIEKQGGKIWVESAIGKGSTFYFSLPTIN